MTKFNRVLLLAVSLVLTLSAAARSNNRLPNLFNKVDQVAMNEWVDSVFNSLSPEARIGQLIVASLTGGYWITGIVGGAIALNYTLMGSIERNQQLVETHNNNATILFGDRVRDFLSRALEDNQQ